MALPFCYGTVAFWLGKKVRRTVCIWHLSWCFDLPLKVEGGRWWRSLPLTQSHMCIGMRTLSIGCCGGSARSGVEAQRGEQSPAGVVNSSVARLRSARASSASSLLTAVAASVAGLEGRSLRWTYFTQLRQLHGCR